jgi:hypothetical protein
LFVCLASGVRGDTTDTDHNDMWIFDTITQTWMTISGNKLTYNLNNYISFFVHFCFFLFYFCLAGECTETLDICTDSQKIQDVFQIET